MSLRHGVSTLVSSRRLRRWAVRLALAVAGVFVLYVVAVNILLGGGRLGRALSGEPEKLRIQYTERLVVVARADPRRRPRPAVRDENVEWEAHVDRADATVALFELLSHRFHTRRIEADGIPHATAARGGRAHPRQSGAPARNRRIPAPPVAGVPPLSSGGGPPLTVVLEGLDLRGVREVWLDAFRLTGDLAVRGGFTVVPGDHFTVTPSHVEVRAASLATGDDGLVRDVHGTIDARIDPVPQAEMKSQQLLRHVSQRSTLEGNVAGIAFLRHFRPPPSCPPAARAPSAARSSSRRASPPRRRPRIWSSAPASSRSRTGTVSRRARRST